MAVRIICINKAAGNHLDPHKAITRLGWVNEQTRASGTSSLAEMVQFLEQGGSAYVKDRYGTVAVLIVRVSQHGHKYVKTIPDSRMTDNLLTLTECK